MRADAADQIFGLEEAMAKLPRVLQVSAVDEFFDSFEDGSLHKVGRFSFYHSSANRWKQAVRFLLIGDVFWFDLYYVQDQKGRWCLALACASLDNPPTVASLRAKGGYLPTDL